MKLISPTLSCFIDVNLTLAKTEIFPFKSNLYYVPLLQSKPSLKHPDLFDFVY